MGAQYINGSGLFKVHATKDIPAGSVVKVSPYLVGIVSGPIQGGRAGWANSSGEYLVHITPGTAYNVGELVTVPAVTPDGEATTAIVGPALEQVKTSDSTATVLFCGIRYNSEQST